MNFLCVCGHAPSWHHYVTYPVYRRPCSVCINCGRAGRNCCLTPKNCPCNNLQQEAVTPEPVDRYTQDRQAGGVQ